MLLISLCCSLLATASPSVAPSRPLDDFVAAVVQRNAIAHDVAAYKYLHGRWVEDPAREAQVLEAKRIAAQQQGLDADDVVDFYRQAIEANKLIQHVAFQRYDVGEVPAAGVSLEQLRVRIDGVDARLLATWPLLEHARVDASCHATTAQAINQIAPSPVDQVALVRAMIGFCRHPRG